MGTAQLPNNQKIVLSASRRTDIPAFYMRDFMDSLNRGFFRLVNPFNRKESLVEVSPERVHSIVFWSKNYGAFIQGGYGETLLRMGYRIFFNFTINSRDLLLEPEMPPVRERLDQLSTLRDFACSDAVFWRFDPICFYRRADGSTGNNLGDFLEIADAAANAGVRYCITSFLDLYRKVKKRIKALPGFFFLDPPKKKKAAILLKMANHLKEKKMRLLTCCEKAVLDLVSPDSGIEAGACIPNHLLAKLYGAHLSLRKDLGQRSGDGCGCRISTDIGAYHLQPCYHNCLYCYANPAPKNAYTSVKEK